MLSRWTYGTALASIFLSATLLVLSAQLAGKMPAPRSTKRNALCATDPTAKAKPPSAKPTKCATLALPRRRSKPTRN